MKSKKIIKSGMILLCVSLMLTMFASCKDKNESSKEDEEKSEVAAEVTSSAAESEDASDVVSGDLSVDESVEDASDVSEESKEISEDASEEISEEPSSEETSEEPSEDASQEISEEIMDSPAVDALEKIQSEYADKCAIVLKTRTEVDKETVKKITGLEITGSLEFKAEYYFDFSGDVAKRVTKNTYSIEAVGFKKDIVTETVQIGDTKYILDHDGKTYVTEKAGEISVLDVFFALTDISSIETKEEVLDGQTYIVDVFTMKNGDEYVVYTQDGTLIYIEGSWDFLKNVLDLRPTITINHDIPAGAFDIPAEYTQA